MSHSIPSSTSIDFASLPQNNIDRTQLVMIPAKNHALDIYSATGYMMKYLACDMQCQVMGVEHYPRGEGGAGKKKRLEVITILIDSRYPQKQLIAHKKEHGLFETIFTCQVIGHIADPTATL